MFLPPAADTPATTATMAATIAAATRGNSQRELTDVFGWVLMLV
jgi:hypothetical protein